MKTVFIYDTFGDQPLRFFVLDGNYQHLNNVYINGSQDQSCIDQLLSILYDDHWNFKVEFLHDFPLLNEKFIVIVVGFVA